MTEQRVITRRNSRRQELGRLTPRSYSPDARWRFDRERRRGYIEECGGAPTRAQVALIDTLISLEWAALKGENDGSMVGTRLALDARRALWRVQAEFTRLLRAPPPAERQPSLAEVLAEPRA